MTQEGSNCAGGKILSKIKYDNNSTQSHYYFHRYNKSCTIVSLLFTRPYRIELERKIFTFLSYNSVVELSLEQFTSFLGWFSEGIKRELTFNVNDTLNCVFRGTGMFYLPILETFMYWLSRHKKCVLGHWSHKCIF